MRSGILLLASLCFYLPLKAQDIDHLLDNTFTKLTPPSFLRYVQEAKRLAQEEGAWMKKNEKASDRVREKKAADYQKKREALSTQLEKFIKKAMRDNETKTPRLEKSYEKALEKYAKAEKSKSKSSMKRALEDIVEIKNEMNKLEDQQSALLDYRKYIQLGKGSAFSLIQESAVAIEEQSDVAGAKKVSLAEAKGKPVMVIFYSNNERSSYSALKALSSNFKKHIQAGTVGYIAVNVDTNKSAVLNDIKRKTFDVPIALDQDKSIRQAYRVSYLPQIVLVDKEGTISDLFVGYNSKIKSIFREQINAFVKEKRK